MVPEFEFIKKLQFFLDCEFNDYEKNRIKSYLKEYADCLPPIVIEKEILRPGHRTNKAGKEKINMDLLMDEVEIFCKEHSINQDIFLNKKNRSIRDIVKDRKKFCRFIIEKYHCTNTALKILFSVDHSTISYYLHGKRYFPSKKQQLLIK